MRKILKDYARKILADHGCDEFTYGETPGTDILRDLKTAYPDGMEFPYRDVANAIISISKRRLLPAPAKWHIIYDIPEAIDGYDSCCLAQAKNDAIDTLINWMCEEDIKWRDEDPNVPNDERVEDWNYMIDSCRVYVAKYNPATDEYEEYWSPSDADLKRIDWVYWKDRKMEV